MGSLLCLCPYTRHHSSSGGSSAASSSSSPSASGDQLSSSSSSSSTPGGGGTNSSMALSISDDSSGPSQPQRSGLSMVQQCLFVYQRPGPTTNKFPTQKSSFCCRFRCPTLKHFF